MTPNICLLGRAGTGKSTVADILQHRLALGYEHLSFAAPLKAGCDTQTDRALLQHVGQGVRDLWPDFWVNLALHGLKGGDGVVRGVPRVVDDCRYKNEYYALLERGFVFIRITAPDAVRLERLRANGKDGGDLNAQSETELDDAMVDHTITNPDDDMDRLERQVVRVMNLVA